MNAQTQRSTVAGPAGALECAIDSPPQPRGVAVVCHPHPQFGGTMDNKVVQTVVRAFVALGYRAVRFNTRGTGASEGAWDEGRGEVDDALAVVQAFRDPALPFALGGFSFGGYVAASVSKRVEGVERLLLVAPAVVNFAVPAVPQDTIIIQGETDDVVPMSAMLDWARPQSLPVTVFPGTGHFFHGQLSLLKTLIVGAWHR
jgi:uncharacterized protein